MNQTKVAKEKKGNPRSILRVVWFFLRPHKLHVTALFILALLVGSLEAATIAAVYPILNMAFDVGPGQGGVILSVFGTIANLIPIEDEFIAYCVLFVLFAILTFIAKALFINSSVRVSAGVVAKNQSEAFNRFIRADYQYFIDHKQGELIYNVATAPQGILALINFISQLTAQVLLAVSLAILLFSLSWQGALCVLAAAIGYHYFTQYLGKKVSYDSGRGELEAGRAINVILNEAFAGIKQVKVFVTGEDWISRFGNSVRKFWYFFSRRNVWQQIPTAGLMLVLYLSLGIIAILIRTIAPTDFSELIPAFGTFTLAIFRLFPIIGTVGSLTMGIMGALPHCEAVHSILTDTLSHMEEGEEELISFKSEIQFDNISFAYKGRAKTVEDISVTFDKGKTTAIVGRSGVGKTTIVNLLLRLFEPSNGEIKIDGLNIKKYKLSSWLNKIGFVSQDTFIFNDTVENNITFHSDGYSHKEVITAAKYADVHGFITELPEGYDTIVGDKGVRLSGGQAQRLAVARAMIREPEILIFDEATNNLDNISTATVQKAIEEISKNHTVIIVAHRLSTIANADKIIVLESGKVMEEGRHEELMEKRGAYWELYRSQPM